jgi:hypothetical protein
MMSPQSWPLDSPAHLADALREQGAGPEEVAELVPALAHLAQWRAPTPTGTETARLLGVLAERLPAPAGWAGASLPWERLRGRWQIVARQPRLIHPGVWLGTTLGIAGAALYAAVLRGPGGLNVLGMFLPIIAAGGMAFLYGAPADHSLEVALATPTSARLVLLSRVVLLLGYDLLLALGATLLVAALHGQGLAAVGAALWLGPVALLSAGSLLLSLVFGPAVAVVSACAVWFAQFISLDAGAGLRLTSDPSRLTNPLVALLAAALFLIALAYVPRQEQFS